MQLYLNHGADINQSRHGWTPLHAAGVYGQVELVEFLLRKGAQLDPGGGDGQPVDSPLLAVARRGGHVQVLKVLLEAGADVSVRGRDGKSVLQILYESPGALMNEKVDLLVKYGAKVPEVPEERVLGDPPV